MKKQVLKTTSRICISPVKILLTCFAVILLTFPAFAQAPERMSYQAVVRNSSDQLMVNTTVGMRISIQKMFFAVAPNPPTYVDVYVETQTPETNANGLVNLEIGSGIIEEGVFSEIEWDDGHYVVFTEIDPDGGTNYTITGRSQLLSVAYALHAKTSDAIEGGFEETDPSVPAGTSAGEMQYWDGSEWVIIPPGSEGQFLSFRDGEPVWVSLAGVSAFGEVYNPTTGKVWMDRNLGASRVATAGDDVNGYGDLYQWGRLPDGHEKRTSGSTSNLSSSNVPGHGDFILTSDSPYDWRSPQNDDLWQGVNGTNNPCPDGYRLPTEAEWNAERESWNLNDDSGAFASPLKLPVAGRRLRDNGSLDRVDHFGYYWSGTVDGTNSRSLSFHGFNASIFSGARSFGHSVRCIKE